MAAAATAAGAEIRTSTAVERILVRDDRVAGVMAGGREIAAPTVVSAVDPKSTFLRLIDPADLVTPDFASRLRNYRTAGTMAKINLALSALPAFRGVTTPQAISGRIHVGPDVDYLERAFDHVKYGECSSAPWLDVTIPSIVDPQLAPPGGHVASVYVHCAPYSLRGNWETARPALLASTMQVLETYAPGIGALVLHAQVLTPRDLESEYRLTGGHVFHGELAPDQLFTMRPLLGLAQYNSPIAGLYLCGAGTHPGGFLTGASGRLAAAEVLRRRRI
jgi:phytoene dehydrogenase-like protein